MNINREFPSKWLTEADLNNREVSLTIRAVTIEDLGQPGSQDRKACVWFNGTEKALALNVTNRNIVVSLYGPETDNWIGRIITVYPTETQFAGKMVPCIRIRTKPPDAEAQQSADPFVEQQHDPLAPPAAGMISTPVSTADTDTDRNFIKLPPNQPASPLPPSGSHFVLEAAQMEACGTSDRGAWTRYSVTASSHRFSTFDGGICDLVSKNLGRTATIRYKLREKYDPLIDSLVLVAPECQECRQAKILDIEPGKSGDQQYWIVKTDKGDYGTLVATIANRAIELQHLSKLGRISYRVTNRVSKRGGNEIVDLAAEE